MLLVAEQSSFTAADFIHDVSANFHSNVRIICPIEFLDLSTSVVRLSQFACQSHDLALLRADFGLYWNGGYGR